MHTSQNQESNIAPFSNKQIAYLIMLFVVGVLFRWLALDARPVHHDESLHLMYGRYFFDWPDQQFYKYDAMLHGPLLYNSLRAVYDLFGSSTWAGRAFTALLGTLFMFTPLFFRKYFSTWAMLALCSAFVLSPSLIYWARFIREDTLQMLFMAVTVIGALYCQGLTKVYVVLIGIVLQFCEKENSFVSLALLIGYIAFELLLSFTVSFKGKRGATEEADSKPSGVFYNLAKLIDGEEPGSSIEVKDTLAACIARYCKTYWPHVIISSALSFLVYAYFYTAGFRYSEGILDGIYRKSLAYWFNQHSIERIPGPFLFHFYTLNWYETIFIALFFVHLVIFYKKASSKAFWIGIFTLVCGATVAFFEMSRVGKTDIIFEQLKPWSLFHLKKPIEILALAILLVQPLIATTLHLLRREKALAFWGYYFWASFFTYSYLGEKVPWLTVYVLLPGIIYLAFFFERYVSRETYTQLKNVSIASSLRWLGVLLCVLGFIFVLQNKEPETFAGNNALLIMSGAGLILFGYLDSWLKLYGQFNFLNLLVAFCLLYTVRLAYMTNYTHSGSEVEFFSQVHTSKRFHNFILDVRRQAEYPTRNGVKPTILSEGESVWPVTWYLVDIPTYKFSATPEERKKFDYIFEDHKAGSSVPDGFCAEVLPLRSWFVPDWETVTLKGYLIYMFNRRPWSTTGSSNVTALVKNADWQNCPRVVAQGP